MFMMGGENFRITTYSKRGISPRHLQDDAGKLFNGVLGTPADVVGFPWFEIVYDIGQGSHCIS
jgi:hypothetical protein